jgi:signal transduction histidine kinase/CheY-like chemotaxis protein
MKKSSFKNKIFLASVTPTAIMTFVLLLLHYNFQAVAIYILMLAFCSMVSIFTYNYINKQIISNELNEQIEMATTDLRQNLDLLEEKNVQLAIEKKKLDDKNKQQSEFIANISHEIRSPLNGILGFANLLSESVLNATQQNYIKMIHTTSSELLITLNDLLDYSKIEAGKLAFNQTPFNLTRCIEELLTHIMPHAFKKDLEIIPILSQEIPSNLIGDPVRIKQVLTNLIDNAIKFTEHGHVLISTTLLESALDSVSVCINITDTGMGIHPDEQSLLFNPFHQANPNIVKRFGGSGLGLAICKKIIEAMNGKIELTSKLNFGTTFSIYLKFKKVILTSINHQDSPEYNLLPTLKESLKKINPKILIAEDQKINQQFIFSLLKPLCQLIITNNGNNAINLAKSEIFELIILDKYMPDIDGVSVGKLLRQDSINKKTPIIIISAEDAPDNLSAIIPRAKWLTKPCNDFDFIQNIISLCSANLITTIDWELCLSKVSGSKSLANQFLHELIQELPQHKKDLINALNNQDIEKIHYIAHKLNGVCCFSGLPVLHAASINLEKIAKSTDNFNYIKKHTASVLKEIDLAISDFKKFTLNYGTINAT